MITITYPTINVEATGARIKKLRKEKGLKVSELSEFMGFSEPQAVYKWQRGETLPSVDNLFALSKILETSIEDILVGDDEVSSFFVCVQQSWTTLAGVSPVTVIASEPCS